MTAAFLCLAPPPDTITPPPSPLTYGAQAEQRHTTIALAGIIADLRATAAKAVEDAAASEAEAKRPQAPAVPPTNTYEVTAYTAGPESTGKRPGDVGYGITASGAQVAAGTTAACPPALPFGTVLRIEGVGERVCQDRGGAIKGRRLDVYMDGLDEARAFGRRRLNVEIIKEAE